eukprot:TRINITY_DN25729_c0_g1_i1.p1 TRINITY_DN25729_c0_g1~~TRINITY_DN25729_c0_g1_i1.p1  ORF type:complete len:165 (+),score=37.68 TRINITY_DN25729_c0_g1_i1:885-1379(+)
MAMTLSHLLAFHEFPNVITTCDCKKVDDFMLSSKRRPQAIFFIFFDWQLENEAGDHIECLPIAIKAQDLENVVPIMIGSLDHKKQVAQNNIRFIPQPLRHVPLVNTINRTVNELFFTTTSFSKSLGNTSSGINAEYGGRHDRSPASRRIYILDEGGCLTYLLRG